ncbi:MAG: NADH-quinone oxidoreductase subunit NuoH [Proteobacteria bacterium]|nr:NADH-quinone oxidoreductase subunit NuoH [Pseudomonadota bacterium]
MSNLPTAPETLADYVSGNLWLFFAIATAAIMGYLTLNALFLIWLERKISAHIQRRLGPMEVGWHGVLQTVADMLKLLSKQLVTPRAIDKPLYHLAPVVVFAPVIASVAMFPFAEDLVILDIELSLAYVFVFGGIGIIGIFMAGWGSNNKYALLGAMRSVAQNISYEIPLILSALSVVLLVSGLEPVIINDNDQLRPASGISLIDIAIVQDAKGWWFVLVQPVAALIYFIAAVAETNRAPFDIPEAESELVAGFHTEYSGMRFAMFFFAEYTNMIIVSMVATVLFFGGWSGPLLPGPVWFFGKTYLLIGGMMWFRWTFPRLRFDQLMSFCWTVLIPLSIVNLLVTALVLELL